MSDTTTPRTDAATAAQGSAYLMFQEVVRVSRELERELAAANGAISESSGSRWIPLTERKPADGQRVLVYRGGKLPPCDYDTDRASLDFQSGFVHNDDVTHWMPLPEAPK